jgi:threonine aldolase
MNHAIDLRSDTVTKPTPAMRRAMAEAEVGDDVYHEDPTVNRLEALAAEMLGKEAAVLVPSGTMGNLIATLSHCGRGDEVILGDNAHMFFYEQGGMAALGGVHPRPVPNRPDGTIDLAVIEAAIRPDDEHAPITRMVALENTHNRCGGRVLPVAYMDAVGELAHRRGLALHVDGARLWNAAVALGVTPARLVAAADSVSCCLSKGLAAPVGSVVAGSKEFIRRARRNRKVVGGGMRQAGVIAAAGIVALTEMIDRLAEDHANARLLAHGLAQMHGINVAADQVESNMVVVSVTRVGSNAAWLKNALAGQGVLVGAMDERRLRLVLNYHVTASDVEHVLDAFAAALSG